jgi:putative membrane protein
MRALHPSAFAFIFAALTVGPASAQPHNARHFLEDALKGDNSEMMLGEMAAKRGTSPALRAFGQTLHDDHAHAREQTVPLARRMGVAITDQPMAEAVQERRKLEHLTGRAFDHEFASYMVKDHKKDIAEFRKQVREGGPAGDLAKQILPDLQKHLAMAERLSRS